MAKETKEHDEAVTPEVTGQHPAPATTRPGFNVQTTDAPDYDPDAAQGPVSARVQEEQAAGRAAVRGWQVARRGLEGSIAANPADADPALAAELAQKMNAEHEEADRREARAAAVSARPPGDVPSRGMPSSGLMEGDELLQGTPDHRTQDPRLLDRDSDLAREGEARKEAQQAEEPRVREQIEQVEQRDRAWTGA